MMLQREHDEFWNKNVVRKKEIKKLIAEINCLYSDDVVNSKKIKEMQ